VSEGRKEGRNVGEEGRKERTWGRWGVAVERRRGGGGAWRWRRGERGGGGDVSIDVCD